MPADHPEALDRNRKNLNPPHRTPRAGQFFTRPQRGIRPLAPRLYRKALTAHEWRVLPRRIATLEAQNRESDTTILGTAEVAVSLTTYGARISSVSTVIESIASGYVRPRRLILWLDDRDAFNNLPSSLRRLQRRGLDIRLTQNFGPHTKYFPYVLAQETPRATLVTADDDMVLPPWWLAKLLAAAKQSASTVTCFRAHEMRLAGGALVPYGAWRECWSRTPSHSHFLTGVSGAAYSAEFLDHLRSRGDRFMSLCPRADDVWLNYVALSEGFRVRQVERVPRKFASLPGSQDVALFKSNVHDHQNDTQIARTFDDSALGVLLTGDRKSGA